VRPLLIALQRAVERDIAQRAARDEARKLAARFAVLSERERLVFDRIVDGLLNKQIADYLGVSERTVKADRAQVMAKLGVSSTAELGRIAERLKRSAADGCLRLMQRNVTPERD
jgi:FixJ family two-component response regulator